jgi:uncharacterized protein (DUF2252 family)
MAKSPIRAGRKKLSVLAAQNGQSHVKPVKDRAALGKALRERCPRGSHAGWTAPKDRPDPIDLLIASSEGRVPHLVPIRYGRMLASPFAFFRGAATIMASDLSRTPDSGIRVQACGDCHLLNFGGFATAERKLNFDINDFDETAEAPWEWDIKRLAASFVIAGQSNGFSKSDCRESAEMVARSYRENMVAFAEMPVLEAWYSAMDLEEIVANLQDKERRRFLRKKLDEAVEESAHEKEFAKLAYESGGSGRIKDAPPLIYHLPEASATEFHSIVAESMRRYRESLAPERRPLFDRYEFADAAIKAVGVGSVGTYCGIVLMMSGNGDPLFLQFKEARTSVLEPYAGASPYEHRGQRVVVGQRLMQSASDMFLGWMTGAGEQARHFYVRQLRDVKFKPVVEIMSPGNLMDYAELCGKALARAHCRSGDAVVLSGYLGSGSVFEESLADFAVDYAAQNELDHAALKQAVRDGRVKATIEE